MLTVLRQEVLLRLRQPTTWGQLLLLLVFSAGMMEAFRTDDELGRVHANAPTRLIESAGIFCLLMGPVVAAVAGTGILRDYELRVHELFFTSRLKPWQYYFGRYLGSFIVVALLFLMLPLGMWLGTVLPGDSSQLGRFWGLPYLFCYGVVLLPNLVLTSALFFVAGAFTRNLLTIYVLGVGLFVCYLIAAVIAVGVGNKGVASALDPYGLTVLHLQTQYWTPAQKNTQLPPLDGFLIFNRVFWSGLGLGVVALGGLLFRFQATGPQRTVRERLERNPRPAPTTLPPPVVARPSVVRSLVRLFGFYTKNVLKSWPYWLFFTFGLVMFLTSIDKEDSLVGTALRPTTGRLLEELKGVFGSVYWIVAVLYAGELTWQDRLVRVAPLVEALPLPRWVGTLARLGAVLFSLGVGQTLLCLVAALVQRAGGVPPDTTALLIGGLGICGVGIFTITALAFCLHDRAPSKFVGHLLLLGITLFPSLAEAVAVEHPLLDYGSLGDWHYSDLDGFQAFSTQLIGLGGFWTLIALTLLALVLRMGRGLQGTLTGLTAAATVVLLVNFHGVHTFQSEESVKRDLATYERTYRTRWLGVPQPRITEADLDVALWPERRAFTVSGRYTLVNKTDTPITEVLLNYESELALTRLAWERAAERTAEDRRLGVQAWRLKEPLLPRQRTTLSFTLTWDKPGFPATGARTDIAANGTFLQNLAPRIGYQPQRELTEPGVRKKHGLGAYQVLPTTIGLSQTYIAADSDWVALTTTVRTIPGQRAFAPGRLVKEWDEGGRRCFRYETPRSVRYFWAVVSGKYATKSVLWQGTPITLYYHPAHPWNVGQILEGARQSLAFCSRNFGPYPFGALNLIEFPARGTAVAAQAFAGTVPFSEEGGFIYAAERGKLDIAFYVAAHEVAHQWWAHQLTGAALPGSEVLSESLAEYTAIRVAEVSGFDSEEVLRRAADAYLKGRAADREEEQPLVTTQRQPYLCYQKGGLAFHSLYWLAGKRFEQILQQYLRALAFQEPPYPTATNLVENLKTNLPDLETQLTELFEKRTLCDLTAVSARTQQRTGKKLWRTTIMVRAKKVFADGMGNETRAPLHDRIVVQLDGVGQESSALLASLQQEQQTITLETDFAPTTVLLDSGYHLFDRERDDNSCTVSEKTGTFKK